MKHLLIIRHGEKENTAESNYNIRKQLRLTEHGEQQAFATGQYLKGHYPTIKTVYASDFPRCIQTAITIKRLLGIKSTVQIEPLLGEHCFVCENVSNEQMKSLKRNSICDTTYKSDSGESVFDSSERFYKALEQIAETMREEEVVAVVTHARVFQNYLAMYCDMAEKMLTEEVIISSCSVSLLVKKREFRVDMLNNSSHVPSKRYMNEINSI